MRFLRQSRERPSSAQINPRCLALIAIAIALGQTAMAQQPADLPSTQPVVTPPQTSASPAAETAATILARIANSGLPERGAHDAKVTIVFFDDFQCPYSAAMYKTLFDDVLKLYSDKAKVVIRPLANSSIHPWAKHAAINASCLAAQNKDAYWDFADYVHAHQDVFGLDANSILDKLALQEGSRREVHLDELQNYLAAQSDPVVRDSFGYANSLRVTAAPTLFVNGEKLESALPGSVVRQAIERALPATAPAQSSSAVQLKSNPPPGSVINASKERKR